LPEVCRDCVLLPTPTPTYTLRPTPTATASPTPRCAAEGACPRLRVDTVSAGPGDRAVVRVEVETAGRSIPAIQSDLAFDHAAPIAARVDGTPDCAVNAEIGKRDSAFVFHPIGCTPGTDCTKIRAGAFAFGDTEPIPDGVLYTCTVDVPADAEDGTHP